jgi:hypothetical protein
MPLKTFTHSTKSFSFQYQSDYTVTEHNGIRKYLRIFKDSDAKNFIEFEMKYSPNYMQELERKSGFNTFKTGVKDIGNREVTFIKYPDLGSVYILPLSGGGNPSEFIFVTIPKTLNVSVVDEIIETLEIDVDIMKTYIDSLKLTDREHAPGAELPGEF